ncbi:hypothetical protein RGCCGE502_17460 [Rhizobium grahamii CCGE 502]|uniref:Uncharacterized protein n=1 Tax=Rhizobium grahamii CCGE 502 TaxID=990285 RepID=S3HUW5_9HYPH|nr:hypothetical protein RGCCGE502_17460 [Rhizobium grahamii CCGE 502]
MQNASYDQFRYGLALLLVRRPYLRCYGDIAHWWSDAVEDYAVAIKARDKRVRTAITKCSCGNMRQGAWSLKRNLKAISLPRALEDKR